MTLKDDGNLIKGLGFFCQYHEITSFKPRKGE